MNQDAWQRTEPRAAAGLVAGAVVVAVAGASAGSAESAALVALAPLALGAGLALDASRRADARAAKLEADAARVVTGRAAAQVELETVRAAAAREVELREAALASAARELDALRERAAQETEQQHREHARLERALRRAEHAAEQQRELLRRLERSRRAEREWNRELRGQLQRLYDSPRRVDQPGDVGGLILEAALRLVEAEKGMLLSREDADGDGALDVALSHGFEHDPADSAVAQRFAREVLALDEIVRDDTPLRDVDAPTPADEEIEALVAIPLYLHDRFRGVIVCANRPGGFEDVDDDVLLALGDQAGAVLHHGQLRNEIREAHRGTVRALVEAQAARDPKLHLDSVRLAAHAEALARDLAFDEWWTHVLITATLVRNLGHLALPERLLAEPRPLRPEERAVIELHPRVGFTIVGQIPALRDVAATILYHQERFDGRGYPAALGAEHIPRAARALAVLEAYGAMTSDRPYRSRRSPEEACEELVAGAGTQFDPEIAQLFVEHIRRDQAADGGEPGGVVEDVLPLDVLADAGSALEPLTAATTDGLTLLGNRRTLEQDLRDAAQEPTADTFYSLVLVQLEDVPRVNEDVGYAAGDRILQLAARHVQRTAARFGGRAYRSSGRRFAVVAPLQVDDDAAHLLAHLRSEFAAGPSVRTALCVVKPDEQASGVLERARRALNDAA